MKRAPVRFFRRSALLLLAVAALPVLASGCDLFTGPGRVGPPLVQTNKAEYTMTLNDTGDRLSILIAYRYENRTDRPINLLECGIRLADPVLEKRRGVSLWEGVWNSAGICGLPTPSETIQPGETYRGLLVVSHPLEPNVYPKMHVEEIAGTYRLDLTGTVFPKAGETRGDRAVPKPLRTSNPFVLKRE